jgi:hypothetical protein
MQRVHPALAPLPFRAEAVKWLQDWGVKIVVRDPRGHGGGGYWWPDRKLVELFTAQVEAAIHEIAHAWWHTRRLEGTNAASLMVAVVRLSEDRDPRFERAAELARHYVYGIATQSDPSSPTGWWRGMLVDGNDWEMYAGLASGVMGDIRKLPRYVRPFYESLFEAIDPDEPG